MKKILAIAAIVCVISVCFSACKSQKTYEGEDEYGRSYGGIYDVDSQETGVFNVPYGISDTSAVGKTMIAANCADYVVVEKKDGGYVFGFLCKESVLGSVKMLADDGSAVDGEESGRDGYRMFAFAVTRETLEGKIALRCEVTVMKKTVEFSVTPNLANAMLVE